ncbi:MAG TPA: GNAT family protein [Phycisphaerales bacterium]|nr:GNAT family protein [Phycisphaerales bacterium]
MPDRSPNPAPTTLVLEGTTGAASATTIGNVTVRPDLLRRLGVAARLAAAPSAPTAPLTLRTERLHLRPLELRDHAEFLRVIRLSRRHLDEFCPLSNREPSQPAETDHELFERQLALAEGAAHTGRAWRAFAFDQGNRIVGAFNINDITRGLEHTGELVFWLSADATRRGYALEGVRAVTDLALRDLPTGLGLCRLIALIAPGNDACLRLARKAGFTLNTGAPPANLRLGGRDVAHTIFQIFADIDPAAATAGSAHAGLVEGKPSIASNLFGRGLLSILRTESEPH